MYQFVIKTVLGLISGLFLGITGILPIGLLLIALDILKNRRLQKQPRRYSFL